MKTLRSAFITGLLVLVPFMLTIDILRWFVNTIDTSARKYLPTEFLPFDFRGLGLLIALIIIILVGVLAQNFIGHWFLGVVDSWVKIIPLGGGIYSSIKKFLETVLNPQSNQFKGVVLVQFPKDGIYSVGFRTGQPAHQIAKRTPKKLVNVFVPCTPNPTSGFYLLVPEEELIALEMSVQEAFKIVVSMGIVTADEIPPK